MSNIWSDFNKTVDSKQLQKDIEAAKGNDFPEVPAGTYHVRVKRMEPKKAKSSGNPMCSIQFQITEGQYKNCVIFYNQVIDSGLNIHRNNEFLESLDVDCVKDLGEHIFKDYEQYGDLIMDIAEEIDEYGLTFDLNYPGPNSWASDFEIEGVYES